MGIGGFLTRVFGSTEPSGNTNPVKTAGGNALAEPPGFEGFLNSLEGSPQGRMRWTMVRALTNVPADERPRLLAALPEKDRPLYAAAAERYERFARSASPDLEAARRKAGAPDNHWTPPSDEISPADIRREHGGEMRARRNAARERLNANPSRATPTDLGGDAQTPPPADPKPIVPTTPAKPTVRVSDQPVPGQQPDSRAPHEILGVPADASPDVIRAAALKSALAELKATTMEVNGNASVVRMPALEAARSMGVALNMGDVAKYAASQREPASSPPPARPGSARQPVKPAPHEVLGVPLDASPELIRSVALRNAATEINSIAMNGNALNTQLPSLEAARRMGVSLDVRDVAQFIGSQKQPAPRPRPRATGHRPGDPHFLTGVQTDRGSASMGAPDAFEAPAMTVQERTMQRQMLDRQAGREAHTPTGAALLPAESVVPERHATQPAPGGTAPPGPPTTATSGAPAPGKQPPPRPSGLAGGRLDRGAGALGSAMSINNGIDHAIKGETAGERLVGGVEIGLGAAGLANVAGKLQSVAPGVQVAGAVLSAGSEAVQTVQDIRNGTDPATAVGHGAGAWGSSFLTAGMAGRESFTVATDTVGDHAAGVYEVAIRTAKGELSLDQAAAKNAALTIRTVQGMGEAARRSTPGQLAEGVVDASTTLATESSRFTQARQRPEPATTVSDLLNETPYTNLIGVRSKLVNVDQTLAEGDRNNPDRIEQALTERIQRLEGGLSWRQRSTPDFFLSDAVRDQKNELAITRLAVQELQSLRGDIAEAGKVARTNLDTNRDGRIDASDFDRNGDGRIDTREGQQMREQYTALEQLAVRNPEIAQIRQKMKAIADQHGVSLTDSAASTLPASPNTGRER